MKQVSVKEEINVTYWEAIDGTRFKDRVECEKYDNSAEALVKSKYNEMVVKTMVEYDLFGCGSEDGNVDIIKVLCGEDVDIVMMMFGIINPHLLSGANKDNYNKYRKIIYEAIENKDFIFIYRGYDNSCFSLEGTLSSRIRQMENACANV